MDRITRALDLARAEGHSALRPVLHEAPRAAPEPEAGLAQTATFRATIVELDPHWLAKQHVLPAGAGGMFGAPYKMLRTQVLQRLDQMHANTLAVMSAMPGSGNTLTAINLAIAIAAELGRTALIVDLNLRNPGVHQKLGFEPLLGVEDCLAAGKSLQEVIVRASNYERLAVLPARRPVDQSSELLSSEAATQLIRELRGRYENRVLIFDLPPVLASDDALAFSRAVQAGLLVVSDGRTQRTELQKMMQLLGELPIIGTVLNQAPAVRRGR
jgi:protein-tyrosine kinase